MIPTGRIVAAAALLALSSGCTASLTAGTSALSSAADQLNTLLPELLMAKYATLHNLRVGLDQIDSSPGMVTSVQLPPVMVSAMPVVMQPVSTPTVPSPSLPTVTPPSGAPTMTVVPPTPVIK